MKITTLVILGLSFIGCGNDKQIITEPQPIHRAPQYNVRIVASWQGGNPTDQYRFILFLHDGTGIGIKAGLKESSQGCSILKDSVPGSSGSFIVECLNLPKGAYQVIAQILSGTAPIPIHIDIINADFQKDVIIFDATLADLASLIFYVP